MSRTFPRLLDAKPLGPRSYDFTGHSVRVTHFFTSDDDHRRGLAGLCSAFSVVAAIRVGNAVYIE